MQYTKWQKHCNIWQIVSILALAGSSPTYLHVQPVSANTPTYSYSFWPDSPEVSSPVDPETGSVELGVKFRSNVDGVVSAVRFYRSVPIDSGYAVHVWKASTSQLIGTGVAIEGQGPTPGWQTVIVYPPAPIKAGEIYIASYYASEGSYVAETDFWTNTSVENGPLHILRQGVYDSNGIYLRQCTQVTDSNCERNSVYKYGLSGGFPTESYKASNYWIDVIFKTNTPPPYFPYEGLNP
ncbi:DUF4082 domain-containing protein [Halotia wernerae UHCC 0503]|nr:DUF4082 domain-containing protein [Halotia wernerae UHCC 0503]